jgi:hypothetical protein
MSEPAVVRTSPAPHAGGFCTAPLRPSDSCIRAALAAGIAVAAVLAGMAWTGLPGRIAGARAPVARVAAFLPEAGATVPPSLDEQIAAFGGDWLQEKSQARIVVTRTGRVWSDLGQMQGRIKPIVLPGANLVFGDDHFFCAYRVTFPIQEVADWRLADSSLGTACPSGIFRRTTGVTL